MKRIRIGHADCGQYGQPGQRITCEEISIWRLSNSTYQVDVRQSSGTNQGHPHWDTDCTYTVLGIELKDALDAAVALIETIPECVLKRALIIAGSQAEVWLWGKQSSSTR